jgi:WD40 repeat protein
VAATKKLLDIPVQPPAAPNAPKGSGNTVLALAFSADNKQLAWGGTDGQIHLVNVTDGKFVRSFAGHDSSITSLAFHPSGTLLVSGSKTGPCDSGTQPTDS